MTAAACRNLFKKERQQCAGGERERERDADVD